MEVEKIKNEILCQQLQLLAERSVECGTENLVKISIAMAKISVEIKQPMKTVNIKTVNITSEYPKQPELVASEIRKNLDQFATSL
ncbi:hypothetical protein [Acetobacterium woodii]|uniref:hypothetical protein n=1 Tax=Acetobacterium woodii TaxID=33952 RepID=UPI0005A032AF|nr:hypothetical protein [Acetobacterium woodii]